MKIKFLIFLTLALILVLNACASINPGSAGEQPPTEIETLPATSLPVTGYQPVQVDQVQVEVGVGSPIPVQVTVTGNLPDTCAQIELVQQKQKGSHFEITISTVPSTAEGCVQDTLPFRLVIPLNITNLPAGAYTAEVNGLGADFQLETGNTTASQPAADTVIRKDDIQVDSLNVEVGVGSPIPVHAIVALSLPNSCAQLGEVRLHREDKTFYVRLIADISERADCREDSIPYVLEVPLNIVGLPEGPYAVNVNGVTASFDPRSTPGSTSEGQACTEPMAAPLVNGKVSYNGISFRPDPVLEEPVMARSCPTVPLSMDQAPGEAHPPYIAFSLPGYSRENTDFQPEVRVYEVTGNMVDYPFPLNMLPELQSTLDQQPEPAAWFRAPLNTRQKYLNFANGGGVRGLVQYMQDVSFFTNNGLLYEFHGLTQDGRYFVNVRYPVSVPFLMELNGFTLPPNNINPSAIAIAEWPSDFEQQRQVVEMYNNEALQRFEQMSDSEAFPDLTLLDQLVRSLEVRQP